LTTGVVRETHCPFGAAAPQITHQVIGPAWYITRGGRNTVNTSWATYVQTGARHVSYRGTNLGGGGIGTAHLHAITRYAWIPSVTAIVSASSLGIVADDSVACLANFTTSYFPPNLHTVGAQTTTGVRKILAQKKAYITKIPPNLSLLMPTG